MLIISCTKNYKKSDLLGTWETVSLTDIETGDIELPESDDDMLIEIKIDSIYLHRNDAYSWQIKGDSILINEIPSVYIKKLTKNELIVEYDFFGKNLLALKKRK